MALWLPGRPLKSHPASKLQYENWQHSSTSVTGLSASVADLNNNLIGTNVDNSRSIFISFWFKILSWQASYQIFGPQRDAYPTLTGWVIQRDASNNNITIQTRPSTTVTIAFTPQNTWNHLAVWMAVNNNMKVWLNGSQFNSSLPVSTTMTPAGIGYNIAAYKDTYLSDIAVWSLDTIAGDPSGGMIPQLRSGIPAYFINTKRLALYTPAFNLESLFNWVNGDTGKIRFDNGANSKDRPPVNFPYYSIPPKKSIFYTTPTVTSPPIVYVPRRQEKSTESLLDWFKKQDLPTAVTCDTKAVLKSEIAKGLSLALTPSVSNNRSYRLPDLSGNQNNGILTNMNAINAWSIRNNSVALMFDGVDDYVSCPVMLSGTQTNITLAGWVFLENTSDSGAFIKIGNRSAVSGGDGWAVGVGNVSFESSGNYILGLFEGVRWITTTTPIGTGWHHFALTSGNILGGNVDCKLYLDGGLVTTSNGTVAAAVGSAGTAVTQIGGYLGSSSQDRFLRGGLDDIRVYSTELSATSITTLYKNGRGYGMRDGVRAYGNKFDKERILVMGTTTAAPPVTQPAIFYERRNVIKRMKPR